MDLKLVRLMSGPGPTPQRLPPAGFFHASGRMGHAGWTQPEAWEHDSVTEESCITHTHHQGQPVGAVLSDPGKHSQNSISLPELARTADLHSFPKQGIMLKNAV